MKGMQKFTLIELLVALALAMIIGAVALTALIQTSGAGSLAHARIDAMHNVRTALRMIENDLRSAYLDPDGFDFWAPGPREMEALDQGPDPVIAFLSVSGLGRRTGPVWVRYDWVEDERKEADVGLLLRTVAPVFEDRTALPQLPADYDAMAAADYENVLAFNVTDFRLRFYHEGHPDDDAYGSPAASEGWLFEGVGWDSADDEDIPFHHRRVPQVIEVQIEAVDENEVLLREENQPVRIRRLIDIGAGLTR